MAKYTKHNSNYIKTEKHQYLKDGSSIFERDWVTIGSQLHFGPGKVPYYNNGNFIFTTSPLPNYQKKYKNGTFVGTWTYDDVKDATAAVNQIKTDEHTEDIRTYAYYGSCVELLRASIENIISTFPGNIKVSNDQLQVLQDDEYVTIDDYYVLDNPFQINTYLKDVQVTQEDNPLHYLSYSYKDYLLSTDNGETFNEIRTYNSKIRELYVKEEDGNKYYQMFAEDEVPTNPEEGWHRSNCSMRYWLPNVDTYSEQFYNNIRKLYLRTTALESGTISFNILQEMGTEYITSISYSTDNGNTWVTTENEDDREVVITVEVQEGESILWKGDSTGTGCYNGNTHVGSFFSSTARFNVDGNVMSLCYGDDFADKEELEQDGQFNSLFHTNIENGCKVVSAKNLSLPATTLYSYCYAGMFYGCTSLTTAPSLPAKTLVENCYKSMFGGCSSLNYINASFITPPDDDYTQNWVRGVAANGTFVKNDKATWDVVGDNGVPNGWSIENPVNNNPVYSVQVDGVTIEGYIYDSQPVALVKAEYKEMIIQPKEEIINDYFNSLEGFEKQLLNRKTKPLYSNMFVTPIEYDLGYLYYKRTYTWPSNDYCIDITSTSYIDFLNRITSMAELMDELWTDNLWKRMTHEAIKNYDWTYTKEYNEGDEEDNVMGGERMHKTINVIGRVFDDIKRTIDLIKKNNRVTYNGDRNIPNALLSDKLELMGWNTYSTIPTYIEDKKPVPANNVTIDDDFLKKYGIKWYGTKNNDEYTFEDTDIAFMRRLLLSSKHILQTKGTRHAIDMVMGMFGYGNGDYEVNEEYRITTPIPYDYSEGEGEDSFGEKIVRLNSAKQIHKIYADDVSGIPVGSFTVAENFGDVTQHYTYLIPYYTQDRFYDGNIVFQSKGGWGYNQRSNNGELSPYGWTETMSYLRVTSIIEDMLNVNINTVANGDIFYVVNLYDYTNYTETDTLFSNFFVLINDFAPDVFASWKNIDLTEKEYTTDNGYTAEEVKIYRSYARKAKYLNSIIPDNIGNNPHIGYGNYDKGEEFFEYLREPFKYAIDKHYFEMDDEEEAKTIKFGYTEGNINPINELGDFKKVTTTDWRAKLGIPPRKINANVNQYLRTTALESGTISFNILQEMGTEYITSISYSTDNGNTWVTTKNEDDKQSNLVITVEVEECDSILWKGDARQTGVNGYGSYFSSDARFNVDGNVMSLCYGDDFASEKELTESWQFAYLFGDYNEIQRGKVVSAENLYLPSILSEACYYGMFSYCTSLVTVPELSATTLSNQCYASMFQGCSSLETAPELPATMLTNGCYRSMFAGCTSLVVAPELPATTLTNDCYSAMFFNCTSLNYIKAMFLTTPSNANTQWWVFRVAANGTFVKNRAASWNVVGNNGIPEGWNVEMADDNFGYFKQYLRTTALESGTISFNILQEMSTQYITSISYSTDNGETWVTTPNRNNREVIITVNVNEGDSILWKGDAKQTGYDSTGSGGYIGSYFSSTARFDVDGNVMSLCYGDDFIDKDELEHEGQFACLFSHYLEEKQCKVVSAEYLYLPSALTEYCYYSMFSKCNTLETAPELSATTLVDHCYDSMFYYCTSLNSIKAMFITEPSDTYTLNWVQGVSESGTFVKNNTATWDVVGNNGVPVGWVVDSEGEYDKNKIEEKIKIFADDTIITDLAIADEIGSKYTYKKDENGVTTYYLTYKEYDRESIKEMQKNTYYLNSKVLYIKNNINSDLYKRYFKTVIMKYLMQVIPSTSILVLENFEEVNKC